MKRDSNSTTAHLMVQKKRAGRAKIALLNPSPIPHVKISPLKQEGRGRLNTAGISLFLRVL